MSDIDPRVVQVFCAFSDGRPSKLGSGYLLDGGLVLTSGHVVGREDWSTALPRVDSVGWASRVDCVVVWQRFQPGVADGARLDAALLRITDPAWQPPADLPPLRWGRLVTSRPSIPVRLTGFPTGMDVHDERGVLVLRDSIQVSGTIGTGSAAKGGRYFVTAEHPVPSSPTAGKSRWEGASGAAVTCWGLVIGVTAEAEVEPGWAWMSAVPTPALLASPEFAALVGHPVAEAAELQPVLEQPGPRQVRSPVSLLRPENEVVRFDRGRDEVLDKLREWCLAEGWFSIRLVVGAGGQGKTRLAAKLVEVMGGLGWSCGFLDERAALPELAVVGDLTTPSLLVVDYAEARAEQLAALADVLDRRARRADSAGRIGGAPAVRVLLLARTAGDWWEELCSAPRLLRDLGSGVVLPLPDLYPDERRTSVLRSVVRDLSTALAGLSDYAGPHDPEALPLPNVTDERFGRPLDLHMAGLTALLQAIAPVTASPDEPDEAILLRHEQHYWKQVAVRFGLGGLSLSARRRLVAVATLCVPADIGQATQILSRLTPPPGEERNDSTVRIARWLASLYPADRDFWGPLRPDRIGEHLVGVALTDSPDLLDRLLPTARKEESLGALQTLARAASHRPHVAGPLREVVVGNPGALAPAAVTAATTVEHPEPLREALSSVLENGADDLPLLDRLYHEVPGHTQALAVWAAELAESRTRLVAAEVRSGSKDFADLASALHTHAYRLKEAGHPDLALPRNATAVKLYEELAEHTPGRFEVDLASAVEVHAEQLYLLGERAEGASASKRAVELRRQLADSPETRRLLADALTGHGNHLSAIGEHADAVLMTAESVDIYRDLPDSVRGGHEREFAAAMTTHAIALHEVGRIEAVGTMRQAVVLLRALAGRFPDASRPDLAGALTNFALMLDATGEDDLAAAVAVESVALYEELAVGLPYGYLTNHAAALHGAASTVANLGRWIESAEYAALAVAGFERMAATGTGEYGLQLGTALDLLASAQSECGLVKESLATGSRAVEVLRPLADHDDLAARAQLGIALRNHAEVLRETGRNTAAKPCSAEALELFRELSRHAPEAVIDELLLALLVHGQVLADLDPATAVRLLDEGMETARQADDRTMVAMFVVALDETG